MPPRFSLIIPVINEDAVINAVIEHLETLRANVSMEIIVVDGDEAGRTIGALRAGNARTATSEKGRGNQMNRGAAMAEGDIVVFLHADTRLPADAFALMAGALSDQTCVAGAFDLAIDSGRPIYRLIASMASFRTRLTHILYGDQVHFFRRVYFNEIGGFASILLMEDVEIMRRIKKRGGGLPSLIRRLRRRRAAGKRKASSGVPSGTGCSSPFIVPVSHRSVSPDSTSNPRAKSKRYLRWHRHCLLDVFPAGVSS